MQPIVSELLLEAYGLTMIKVLLTVRGVMAARHVRFFLFFFLNMISLFLHERMSENISVHMHS